VTFSIVWFPATVVIPSRSIAGLAAASRIAMASSCPGSQSRMIFSTVGPSSSVVAAGRSDERCNARRKVGVAPSDKSRPSGDGIILGGVHRTDLVGLLLFHAHRGAHPAPVSDRQSIQTRSWSSGSSIGDEMNNTCGASSNWPPCGVFAGITHTSPFLTGCVTPSTVMLPVPSST